MFIIHNIQVDLTTVLLRLVAGNMVLMAVRNGGVSKAVKIDISSVDGRSTLSAVGNTFQYNLFGEYPESVKMRAENPDENNLRISPRL